MIYFFSIQRAFHCLRNVQLVIHLLKGANLLVVLLWETRTLEYIICRSHTYKIMQAQIWRNTNDEINTPSSNNIRWFNINTRGYFASCVGF